MYISRAIRVQTSQISANIQNIMTFPLRKLPTYDKQIGMVLTVDKLNINIISNYYSWQFSSFTVVLEYFMNILIRLKTLPGRELSSLSPGGTQSDDNG